ncbi:Superfamily I DNA and RNA helicase, partial [human gut metagenome]
SYVNNLLEELVDEKTLMGDPNKDICVLGSVLEVYKEILEEHNLVDFASIQTEAYRLLNTNSEILKILQQ